MRTIGIDLGGTKIEGAVVVPGPPVRVERRLRVATERERGYEHILDRVAGVLEALQPHAPEAALVGIGTPGSASVRTGLQKNSNTECLNGRPLGADLEARLGRPIRLENDANCFALAEARAGAGRGHALVFGVILGTGVGGGIVHDGRLWVGPQRIAGEWGHHAIDPAGPACYCGQRGCVETLLSGPALEAAYRDASAEVASRQAAGARRLALSAREITAHAAAGEAVAAAVVERWIGHFGRALANVVAILDPDAVVLGGGLSNVAALYSAGRDAVARCVFNDELRTPILRHALGDSAGVVGAALLTAP